MVEYHCIRCGYTINKKSSMINHLKRKRSCKPILNDVNLEEYKDIILNGVDPKEHQISQLKQEIKELKQQQIQQPQTIINNTTNNIFNITLPYNKTNHEFLSDKDYMKCINRMIMSVPNLIKRIHFNPEHPENHNIYINDINRNRIMVFDGAQWNVQNQKDTIDRLINDHDYLLDEWVACGEEKYPHAMEKFKKYVELRSQNEVESKIKDEVRYILYNNRDMISNKDNKESITIDN